jgi:hypothetical protein
LDERLPPPHQARLVGLPQLVAFGTEPAAPGVALVLETDGDVVVCEAPERLDQTIVEFPPPLARQELPDLVPAPEE